MKCVLIAAALFMTTHAKGEELVSSPKIAITIKIKAVPGKEAQLAELLTGAATLVKKTEPQTLYWFATREKDVFTINDGFADEAGVQAHFDGQVAAALKAKAGELVSGGWDNGVLPNVVRGDILSTIK